MPTSRSSSSVPSTAMQRSCNGRVHKFRPANRHNRRVNSTETPGGSGIPAGWYDDPSGQGLRWWDGEAWTEHVHTAESAAAAASAGGTAGEGEREAPPPELVKLRESIRGRGAKGVGMVLGAVVLIVVVVALLASGGGESNGGEPGTTGPGAGAAAAKQAEIKAIDEQLKNKKLPKAEKKTLEAEKKKLEKGGESATKSTKKKGDAAKKKAGAKQKKSPGEEGN
jgi:Protein of unknown function (DUF2510)